MMISSNFFYYNLLGLLLLPSLLSGADACDFRCGDGSCISVSELCNGQKDCPDGSDETQQVCQHRPCKNALGLDEYLAEHSFGLGSEGMSFVSSFRCDYGGCITINFKCNGISNCIDGSDETEEACKDTICSSSHFRCDYGACVSRYDVCDGIKNCKDGSDERKENCIVAVSRRRVVCPRRSRKRYCDNRRECYDLRKQCDGKFDCRDRSDEKAELCNPDEVVTSIPPTTTPRITTPPPTAPPPTTPPLTTPPPTTPPPTIPAPMVFPEPVLPAQDDCLPPNCRCTIPGLEHFCLPCGEIADLNATCLSLNNPSVCSIDKVDDVSVDVLSCGTQTLMTAALFSRSTESCGTRRKVPAMTLVFVDCWGVSSTIMRCHQDGYWRAYGAQVSNQDSVDSLNYLMEKQPMEKLCQPYFMNSNVCGRRPRYMHTGTTLHLGSFHRLENRWPMTMGLKKRERVEKYVCSATLISPRFLLTAGHCVIISQASRNRTVDVRNLRVQLSYDKSSSTQHNDHFVSDIILHPDYVPGLKPLNDLALIRLEIPLVFHRRMYPACVDLVGEAFLSPYRAVTFNRPNGQNEYGYEEILQQIDPSCRYPSDRCNQLLIEETQFCGVDLDTRRHLVGGSSGGPFMQNIGTDASEEWVVSGVVSFRDRKHTTCSLPHTVFTLVNNYASWITSIVHEQI